MGVRVAQQRAPECIVCIDDRMLQLRPREQLGLRSGVALERAVIVQVIARQVGEDRGIEAHAIDTMLVERMRRHFHRETSHACVAQFGELTVHRDGIRGRVRHCLQCIDAAETDRARVCGSRAEQLRRGCDEVRGCRLAVRASHADRAHGLRRRAEEAIGDRAENRGEIRHGEQQHAVGHARRGDTRCRFPQDRSRPGVHRLSCEADSVRTRSRQRDECAAELHAATIEREIHDPDVGRHGDRGPGEQRSQILRSCVLGAWLHRASSG